MESKQIGQRLRNIRESNGLSGKDVEDLIGGKFKKSGTILKWETNPERVKLMDFIELCEFYGVNPAEVLNPKFEVISVHGLNEEDRKLLRKLVTRLRGQET